MNTAGINKRKKKVEGRTERRGREVEVHGQAVRDQRMKSKLWDTNRLNNWDKKEKDPDPYAIDQTYLPHILKTTLH